MPVQYLMESQSDCGPAMTRYMLSKHGVEISYSDLKWEWMWPVFEWMQNLRDSPGAHWRILRKHGIPWKVVTLEDILGGKCVVDNVCVLIHSKDNPDTPIINEGLIYQHWIPLTKVTDTQVQAYYGDGTERFWNLETFKNLYKNSFPDCAYEVGVGSTDWTWEMTWDVFMQALPVTLTVFGLLVYALLKVFYWHLPLWGI